MAAQVDGSSGKTYRAHSLDDAVVQPDDRRTHNHLHRIQAQLAELGQLHKGSHEATRSLMSRGAWGAKTVMRKCLSELSWRHQCAKFGVRKLQASHLYRSWFRSIHISRADFTIVFFLT